LIRVIYQFAILITSPLWDVAAFFSPKIKAIVNGRKETNSGLRNLKPSLKKRIWIHSASLGEFEMALPLVEVLNDGSCEFHFSFYSPSGYENAKLTNTNSFKWYLLNDSMSDAKNWIKHLSPQLAIFVKYEFWLNHLIATNKNNIPFIYWNVLLRKDHFLNNWYAKSWWKELKKAKKVFVQNEFTKEVFHQKQIPAETIGDIRFLRSSQSLNRPSDLSKEWQLELKKFQNIIFGSSWDIEEQAAFEYLKNSSNNNFKVVLVPHDVSKNNINRLINQFKQFGIFLYSNGTPNKLNSNRVLLIDTIGLLQSVYRVGSFAVVGGGFKNALHNIIEPLSCSLPVICGDQTEKFPEAKFALNNKALIQCTTPIDIANTIVQLVDCPELMVEHREYAFHFFNENLPDLDNAFYYCRSLMTN